MKEAIRANFNASVAAYEAYEHETGRFTALTRLLLAEMVVHTEREIELVLDAGAGTGVSTAVLSDVATPIALDLSREMLRSNPSPARIEGDMDALPIQDDGVDAVAYTASLFLVPDPAVAVAEAERVLRPGGVVAAVAPAGWTTGGGGDPFADLDRRPRSPVSAGAVRQALADDLEVVTGTWQFPTTADELRLFHEIPAMAARFYPQESPVERVRKTRSTLESLAGTFEHRWEWTVGIVSVRESER